MNVKKMCIIILIAGLLLAGLCLGSYTVGAANTRNSVGAERRAAEIVGVHTELGNEQRTNNERLANIIRVAEETNAALGELRQSNRRSGDLLQLLEEEVNILDDFLNNLNVIIGGNSGDNADSVPNEVE